MAIVVALQDIVDAMDLPNDEWTSYLSSKTGEVVTVTDEERDLVEDEELDETDLPEWQRENLPKVRQVLESEEFLQLPDKFEIHEWSIMERFSNGQVSGVREALRDAVHGAGAFRSFKNAIRRLAVEEEWFRFRQAALEEIATAWLETHNIPYRSRSG